MIYPAKRSFWGKHVVALRPAARSGLCPAILAKNIIAKAAAGSIEALNDVKMGKAIPSPLPYSYGISPKIVLSAGSLHSSVESLGLPDLLCHSIRHLTTWVVYEISKSIALMRYRLFCEIAFIRYRTLAGSRQCVTGSKIKHWHLAKIKQL